MESKITFSFGENWLDLAQTFTEKETSSAIEDIVFWLKDFEIKNKTVLDIGCGSGLHSLAFHQLGVSQIHSLDYDPKSVEATQLLCTRVGGPAHWKIEHGSVLDHKYMSRLGVFDIVYSWGVLHHTGDMWTALANASNAVKPGGLLFISIYKKGPGFEADLAMKKKYNSETKLGKWLMERKKILGTMRRRFKNGRNPFKWNEKRNRGMDTYHDIVDWLGGLPYEVATEDEIVCFYRKHGLILERIKPNPESTCSIYLFSKPQN